jgi:hypothetical protein
MPIITVDHHLKDFDAWFEIFRPIRRLKLEIGG